MEVRIKKVMDGACLPQKAHAQDAGFDLRACKVERVGFDEIVCHTGLVFKFRMDMSVCCFLGVQSHGLQ